MAAVGDEDARRKLLALYRSLEIAERVAFEEFQKIEAVYNQRSENVTNLVSEKEQLAEELETLRKVSRTDAVIGGNVGAVSSILSKEKSIGDRIEKIEMDLVEAESDLEKASDRLKMYEKDLLDSRIEKKKVERLMENRENFARNVNSASSERESDEMSYFLRKKGK